MHLRITSHGCLSGNIRIHSKRGTIKLSYQLIESDKIPSIGNFLPYSLWPPMVKHYLKATGKTRLQLMQEEEQVLCYTKIKFEKEISRFKIHNTDI